MKGHFLYSFTFLRVDMGKFKSYYFEENEHSVESFRFAAKRTGGACAGRRQTGR